MTRRLPVFLVALFALGAVAVMGCGDDDDDKGDKKAQTAPSETTTAPAETGEATTEPDTGETNTQTSGKGQGAASGKQVVDSCKKSVAAQQQLSETLRSKLESTCEEVGSGDTARVRRASREICRAILNETAPAKGRAKALKACDGAPVNR